MKRHVLRLFGIAALAGGGVLAFGAPAQAAHSPGVVTGNGFASIVQTPKGACGNAVAVDGVVIARCGGGAMIVSNGIWSWEWPAGGGADDGPMAWTRSRTWS
jgi:hypothetical protein